MRALSFAFRLKNIREIIIKKLYVISALPSNATSSLYMKVSYFYHKISIDYWCCFEELCEHLKVFRGHAALIQPLFESVDVLPNFLNSIVEQFLLHITLVRPLKTDESVERFTKDLEYLCRIGLYPFGCRTAKLMNSHQQVDWENIVNLDVTFIILRKSIDITGFARKIIQLWIL